MASAAGSRPVVVRRSRLVRRLRRFRRTGGEVLRREGARRLLARAATVVCGTVYRRVVLVAVDLTQELPDGPCDVPIEIRLLQAEDAEAYARFRSGTEPDRVARRLDEGHVCVAAWLEGEIVTAQWYAFGRNRLDAIGRPLDLAEDEVYAYDSYTAEPLRGRRLATARAIWACRYLRGAGYRRTLGYIAPQNRPAFGPPRRVEARELGTAGFVRLGPWRRDFVRVRGGRRVWTRPGTPIEVGRDFAEALAGE